LKKHDIIKYLEGKSSQNEKTQIEDFIKDKNLSKNYLDEIFEDFWKENKDYSKDEVFSGVLFNEIESRIDQNYFESSPNYQNKPKRTFRLVKYAASIAVFFALFIYFLQDQFQPAIQKPSPIEMVLKQTSKGQKSTIILSDGSKVILNSQSQISYPKYFTDSTRLVTLKGEAYFEVAKDITRPFSVVTNSVKTTALGTSFNINGRTPKVKVSLATGKVVVQSGFEKLKKENHYFLIPGEAIIFDPKSNDALISTFDYKSDFSWKDGVLYFHNADFYEIKSKLEVWYDIEFDIENKQLAKKKFTGRFDNETLKSVMESVGFALDYDYFVNGKKVKVIFNK